MPPPPFAASSLAKGLRAFGDGYVSLLLPLYLLDARLRRRSRSASIATATLLGSGALTLLRRPARASAFATARCCSPRRC